MTAQWKLLGITSTIAGNIRNQFRKGNSARGTAFFELLRLDSKLSQSSWSQIKWPMKTICFWQWTCSFLSAITILFDSKGFRNCVKTRKEIPTLVSHRSGYWEMARQTWYINWKVHRHAQNHCITMLPH